MGDIRRRAREVADAKAARPRVPAMACTCARAMACACTCAEERDLSRRPPFARRRRPATSLAASARKRSGLPGPTGVAPRSGPTDAWVLARATVAAAVRRPEAAARAALQSPHATDRSHDGHAQQQRPSRSRGSRYPHPRAFRRPQNGRQGPSQTRESAGSRRPPQPPVLEPGGQRQAFCALYCSARDFAAPIGFQVAGAIRIRAPGRLPRIATPFDRPLRVWLSSENPRPNLPREVAQPLPLALGVAVAPAQRFRGLLDASGDALALVVADGLLVADVEVGYHEGSLRASASRFIRECSR